MLNSQNLKKQAFTFEPPAGGDITLRSNDGITFSAHTFILGLVSPVFSDMLSIGKQSGEIIELDDDAESISMLLAFIYPSGIWPTIENVDMLEKCLQIAQKYNIEKIPQALDRDLALNSERIIAHYKDPLRVFRLAVTYGLRNCQTLAAKCITPKHIDLRKPSEVVKVAQEYPGVAHVVGLVSVQTMRVKILADTLFGLDAEFVPYTSMVSKPRQERDFEDIDGSGLMMCDECISRLSYLRLSKVRPISYIPSWLYPWSRNVYDALSSRPIEDCEDFFTLESLIGLDDEGDACILCLEAAREAAPQGCGRPGEVFESWARSARYLIARKFKELDPLYSL